MPANRCGQSIFSDDTFDRICITCGSQLYGFAPGGTLQFSFGRNSNGAITAIDASNPMKIAVYFASSNQIYILDNHGNPIGTPIKVDLSGTMRASSIGMTGDGNIWLFDVDRQILRLFSPAGTVLSQSTDISKYVKIANADSIRIVVAENRIILTEGNQVSVFSSEAAFINSTMVGAGCKWLNNNKSGAYYQCGDSILCYNVQSRNTVLSGRTGQTRSVFATKDFFITTSAELSDYNGQTREDLGSDSEKTIYIRSVYLTE